MDLLNSIAQSFDMLDIVLAVFLGCIFALWRGRGKKLSGLLSGALIGGLIKPALFFMIGGAAIFTVQQEPKMDITPAQEKKIDNFWSKLQ